MVTTNRTTNRTKMAAFSRLKSSFGEATASIKHNIKSSSLFFFFSLHIQSTSSYLQKGTVTGTHAVFHTRSPGSLSGKTWNDFRSPAVCWGRPGLPSCRRHRSLSLKRAGSQTRRNRTHSCLTTGHGLERKSGAILTWNCLKLSLPTCRWLKNKTSMCSLQAQDSPSQPWYWSRRFLMWTLARLKRSPWLWAPSNRRSTNKTRPSSLTCNAHRHGLCYLSSSRLQEQLVLTRLERLTEFDSTEKTTSWLYSGLLRTFACLEHLPVFCHPGLPDAFSHIFIGSFPGTALEHGVVGDTGFQTGAGGFSQDNFAFLQLCRKKTFGWSPKHAEQMKKYQETLADIVLKWIFTNPGH